MGEFFWGSSRRARKEHHCDHCFEAIYPGHVYFREIWSPGGSGFIVMKRHINPGCPHEMWSEESEYVQEELQERVQLVFVAKTREVHKVLADGRIVTESETHFVTQLVTEASTCEDYNDDSEDPF